MHNYTLLTAPREHTAPSRTKNIRLIGSVPFYSGVFRAAPCLAAMLQPFKFAAAEDMCGFRAHN
eukprot:1395766-Alexandrium_andersonii.AAC.1